VAEEKQRLDPSCWKGYRKAGTKMKGGVRVNNCVPNESAGSMTVGMKSNHNAFKESIEEAIERAAQSLAEDGYEFSESSPKGYDSDGNPLGGGYDEYHGPAKWTVAIDGRSWKSFDDEKEAYRAAASIERKYGKKTRVHKEY